MIYADTSAIVRSYFVDEAEHEELRALLLSGDRVVSSELARVELASAAAAALRAGRLRRSDRLLSRFDAEWRNDGLLTLLDLDPALVLPHAYRLVLQHRLRTLDAIHLAVALDAARALAVDELVFVSRDVDQAAAASALGLAVA
ncbi:MAG TPA: PIN domain-containing protein [Gaiellaceae bacterium]|nr:PIN domain-containing protein [Gaiellaceae bacterium]